MWNKLYPKVLYLIHNSVIYDFYIGKWITESTTGIAFGVSESSKISITVQGAGNGYAYTEKMIDVTNFTNLKVNGTFQGRNHANSDSNNILKIGVGAIKEFTTYDSTVNNTTNVYNFEYSIDLSNVDGEKNFIIAIERTGAFGSVLTINEICFS